jgi:hypothetical protein
MNGQLEPIFQAAARAAGMRVEASAEQQTAVIGEDVAVDPVAPAPESDDAPAQKPTVASGANATDGTVNKPAFPRGFRPVCEGTKCQILTTSFSDVLAQFKGGYR